MNKIFETSLLLDFYGQLLTKRQQEILELNINNDFSLGEISEQLKISRQGVYDNIKRARNSLTEFEDKLHLVSKFTAQKKKAEEILHLVNQMDKKEFSKNDSNIISEIERNILDIVNENE